MVFQIHQTHLAWQQPTWSVCRSFFHFSCLVVKTKGVVHFFLLLPHWQHTDKNKLSTEELKIAYPGDCSVIHRHFFLGGYNLVPATRRSYLKSQRQRLHFWSGHQSRCLSFQTALHDGNHHNKTDPLKSANLATAEQKILCSVLIRILHRKHSTV